MGDYSCIRLELIELFWVVEMIDFIFRFKKYNNGSFFIVLLFYVESNLLQYFIFRTLRKLNFSSIWRINWGLHKGSFNTKPSSKDLFLFLTHALKCACNSKNTGKIRWKHRIRKASNDEIDGDLFLKLVFGDSLVDIKLMVIIEDSSVSVMNLVGQTVSWFVVNLAIFQRINIVLIIS